MYNQRIIPMKNILIPTTLQADTINAVKTAIKQSKGKNCSIILLQISDVPDTDSSAFFLRSVKNQLSVSQKSILDSCRNLTAVAQNCTFKLQHQYGISAPLMRNLLEHLHVGLIILTPSYKKAERKIHNQFLQILTNCKFPILHLNSNFEEHDFNKAMYLEQTKSKLQAEDLQQLVQDQFDFKIVSQAIIFEDQNPEEISPQLFEAISRNEIDLLIQTRKPEKIKSNKKSNINESLGLPVLSLYEELA
jgi:hypothetical protein